VRLKLRSTLVPILRACYRVACERTARSTRDRGGLRTAIGVHKSTDQILASCLCFCEKRRWCAPSRVPVLSVACLCGLVGARVTRHGFLSASSIDSDLQAGRVIAQLLVSGGMIVFRAAAQAYQQALVSAAPRHRDGTPSRCACVHPVSFRICRVCAFVVAAMY
jgi:hypothetical protein